MNFFTLLKEEHDAAKKTLRSLLDRKEIDREGTETVCNKLLLHMEMEEKYFYPLMERYKATHELSEEAELEHTEARKFIKALQNDKLDDTEYKVKLEMLQLAIEHHIEEEESEIFPKAKQKLDEEQIRDITEKMQALKEKKQVSASR